MTGNQRTMNTINPFPHASPTPGPMGNQTLPVCLIFSRSGTQLRINRIRLSNVNRLGFWYSLPERIEGILRIMFMSVQLDEAPVASIQSSPVQVPVGVSRATLTPPSCIRSKRLESLLPICF